MSAFQAGQAIIDFKARGERSFSDTTGRMARVMDRFKARVGGALRIIRRGLLIGGAALAAGLAFAVREAAEAEKQQAKLNAVLEATGFAAGKSADELNKMAGDLRDMTGIEDELITANQALLLTFKQIRGDVFDDALLAALDMSNVMEQDLKSSIIQVGKALNDPILGLTALSRVGVSFTKQQKEMIRTMQEAGDVAGAQGIILQELQSEFGGAAKAAGKTFGGQINILKGQIGDAAEEMGSAMIPGLKELTKALGENREEIKEWAGDVGRGIGEIIRGVINFRRIFVRQMNVMTFRAALFVSEFVDALIGAGRFVVQFIFGIGTDLRKIFNNMTQNIGQIFFTLFGTFLPSVLKAFQALWVTTFQNMFNAGKASFNNLGTIAAGFFQSVLTGSLTPLQTALKVTATDISKALKPVGDPFLDIDLDLLKNTVDILKDVGVGNLTPDKPNFVTEFLRSAIEDLEADIKRLELEGTGKPPGGEGGKGPGPRVGVDGEAGAKAQGTIFGNIVQNQKRIQQAITGGDIAVNQRDQIIKGQKENTKTLKNEFAKTRKSLQKNRIETGAFIAGS